VRDASEPETGQSAVVIDGASITVRVPWTLLNVTDPSALRVLDDDPTTRPRETTITEGFRVAVSIGNDLVETERLRWAGWESAPHYEERRKLGFAIFADGLRQIPDR
ncbi:MAG: hypothetical protein KIS78_17060, partial [Labilithrix sp.]|nr:hypothetical protein [Labilithrix sp.]